METSVFSLWYELNSWILFRKTLDLKAQGLRMRRALLLFPSTSSLCCDKLSAGRALPLNSYWKPSRGFDIVASWKSNWNVRVPELSGREEQKSLFPILLLPIVCEPLPSHPRFISILSLWSHFLSKSSFAQGGEESVPNQIFPCMWRNNQVLSSRNGICAVVIYSFYVARLSVCGPPSSLIL